MIPEPMMEENQAAKTAKLVAEQPLYDKCRKNSHMLLFGIPVVVDGVGAVCAVCFVGEGDA